jgi:3-phosphoglycerate kinase
MEYGPIDGVRSWRTLDVKGRRVLVRSDLNPPYEDRLASELPLYRHVLENGGNLFIMTHGPDKKSVCSLVEPLERATGHDVVFFATPEGAASTKLLGGEIGLLENTRMTDADKSNDPAYAARLASVGDVIVVNGASACHRPHASVVGMLEYQHGFSGPLLEEEWHKLKAFSGNGSSGDVAAVGGSKLEEKMAAIEHFAANYKAVLLGGRPLNNYLKAMGMRVGLSSVDDGSGKEYVDAAKRVLVDSVLSKQLRIPTTVVCVREDFSDPDIFDVSAIPDDRRIVDVHADFVDGLADEICAATKALLVGPLGHYEKGFTSGTEWFVNRMPADSLVMGGDTVKASGYRGRRSLGGGAAIELLLGKEWAAVEALRRNAERFDDI